MEKHIAIIGAGAAGCFAAVHIVESLPDCAVTVFESSAHPLHKLALTGGGRCNLTNTFSGIRNLADAYPRGHRLLRSLFYRFGHRETTSWFERHGIPLSAQDDDRVFPRSDNAMEVVNLLLGLLHRHNVTMLPDTRIRTITPQPDQSFLLTDDKEATFGPFDCVLATTGGMTASPLMQSLASLGHEIIDPVPSLFSLKVNDPSLHALMGVSVPHASVLINGTRLRAQGALLVTHVGLSGPAVLRLSSYAARDLARNGCHCHVSVNWTGLDEQAMRAELERLISLHAAKNILSAHPDNLTRRLWAHLVSRAGIPDAKTFAELGKKDRNRLLTALLADNYSVSGRGQYKEEFVTCGGVSLNAVNHRTLESKSVPRLFFAGEVLDIDAVTGGFNLQAAWTTAFVAADAISQV
ncbi:MAG: aminoacetone oxidase family FAD-binding enzyme [Paludibacteraceae bacterium]|nr:aminoacetone oxidase family FAD-binding enzyme [Paludibacteraceae bacterium]